MSQLATRIEAIKSIPLRQSIGRVVDATSSRLWVEGLSHELAPGTLLSLADGEFAEVVRVERDKAICFPYQTLTSKSSTGDVTLAAENQIAPGPAWIGQIIDGLGRDLAGKSLPHDGPVRPLGGPQNRQWPAADQPPRIETGVTIIDSMLPLVEGQRIGLFAGPGVGKTSLLAQMAERTNADAVVLALVGERRQEAARFVAGLPDTIRSRMIAVISPADEAPALRRRAMRLAFTCAEALAATGRNVLFLGDSLTRHLDAHRDMALAVGEPVAAGGYPASMAHELAGLAERAGRHEHGSITAVFTVLAPASDLDGPVPDTARAALDGHIILNRDLAASGRFPAVDLAASVSRALPGAVPAEWMDAITRVRSFLQSAEADRALADAGLLEAGTDPQRDAAMKRADEIDLELRRSQSVPTESLVHDLAKRLMS